jgi:hypothetical protein
MRPLLTIALLWLSLLNPTAAALPPVTTIRYVTPNGGGRGTSWADASHELTYPSIGASTGTTLSGDIDNDGALGGNSYHVIYNPPSLATIAILNGFTGGVANEGYGTAYNRADDVKPPVTVAAIDLSKLITAYAPESGGNAKNAKAGLPAKPSPAQIKYTFDAFDGDYSGQVSFTELLQVLIKSGVKFTEDQAKQLIKMFDANSSGMMELNEFERLIDEALKHPQPKKTQATATPMEVANPAKKQREAGQAAGGQARLATTKATENSYYLTDNDGITLSLRDAGTSNGGQSLSGTSSTFLLPVDVIISRQPDNTWSWSITIASIPLIDFTNGATSTMVPMIGWVNEDERPPFDIIVTPGACPTPPMQQVRVTLCDGSMLTLTELLPTFFSSDDLSYGMYLDKSDGQIDTWLFDYTVNETVYQWRATQPVGSTLPPASGWTETSTNGCLGTAVVTVPCVLVAAQATSAVVMSELGPGNCAVQITSSGTGNTFVYRGPGGEAVYSTVYRTGGSYTLPTFTVTKPGTYTMTAYMTNACGQSSQDSRTFVVGGRACD